MRLQGTLGLFINIQNYLTFGNLLGDALSKDQYTLWTSCGDFVSKTTMLVRFQDFVNIILNLVQFYS